MAHNVEFSIPPRGLGKADVTFCVSHGGSKVGTLKVSKGSVVWVPKGNEFGYKLAWRDFGDIMTGSGNRIRES